MGFEYLSPVFDPRKVGSQFSRTSGASSSLSKSNCRLFWLFRKAYVRFFDAKNSKNFFLICGLQDDCIGVPNDENLLAVFLTMFYRYFVFCSSMTFFFVTFAYFTFLFDFLIVFFQWKLICSPLQPWFSAPRCRRLSPRSSRFSQTASQSQIANVHLTYPWLF